MIALLYDVDVRTVNYHLKTIFSDSELEETSVIRNFRITAADGKTYDIILLPRTACTRAISTGRSRGLWSEPISPLQGLSHAAAIDAFIGRESFCLIKM
ncbi:MAG TPA: hypothetical protein PK821_08740 [Victivallales bacterium]|nr:hypothetical protein [Victivallales bacterium]